MKKSTTISLAVTVGLLLSSCGAFNKARRQVNGDQGPGTGEPQGQSLTYNLSLDRFANCGELKTSIADRVFQQRWAYEESNKKSKVRDAKQSQAASPATAEGAASSAQGTFTNVQEAGVDEADNVKIGEHHIIIQRGRDIVVVDRSSKAVLGYLPISESMRPSTLYLDGDRLVRISEAGGPQNQILPYLSRPMSTSVVTTPQETIVDIYQLDASKMPQLLGTKKFSGSVNNSRLSSGKLVLVAPSSSYVLQYIYNDKDFTEDDIPVDANAGAYDGVPCANILKPLTNDSDFSLTRVFSINVQDINAEVHALAVPGYMSQLYMAPKDIFLVKQYFPSSDWTYDQFANEGLLLTRISLDTATGALNASAVGRVPGQVYGQWAFKYFEKDDALGLVTSTSYRQNHLFITRQDGKDMKIIGQVRDFGTNERVQSVRYVGTIAYVVTFRQVDPLFAINVADPTNPTMLGELKVPGFSTYMHSAGEGRLLGFGYDATDSGRRMGMQLSLFDVSNPAALSRLAAVGVGSTYAYSEAINNHHAFMYNQPSGLVSIPVGTGGWKNDADNLSGAVLYKISSSGIDKVGSISHRDLNPRLCYLSNSRTYYYFQTQDVMRSYVVGDEFLTISAVGLKVSNVANPAQTIKQVAFETSDQFCK